MRIIIAAVVLTLPAFAGDFTRVFHAGGGTVQIVRVRSFDSAQPLAADEVQRLAYDATIPAPDAFVVWDRAQLQPMSSAQSNAVVAAQEAAEASAAQAALLANYESRTEAAWPLLAAHPTTNEVPAKGMCYRLSEGGATTWWVLRQGDLIATQISAHNAAGEQIVRSINLKTGDETEVNLARLCGATSFIQMRAARVVRTNALGRATR